MLEGNIFQITADNDLKVLHCNHADYAGGDESITSPDTGGNVGSFTSLALDGGGYPVARYFDASNFDLKVLHRGSPGCISDSTPPTISANASGTLGDNGWYIGDVKVSWTVIDDESTVFSTSGCETTSIDGDTAGTALTCEATSDGGTNSASVTIQRDAIAPTTSADVILSNEGIGQSASGTCTDLAGNISSTATASGIDIDKTTPVVSVTGVEDGPTYTVTPPSIFLSLIMK